MRRPTVRLYAPFLAIALIQALFIAIAPSTGPGHDLALGSDAPTTDFDAGAGGFQDPGEQTDVDSAAETADPATPDGGTPGTSGGTSAPSAGGGAAGGGSTATPSAPSTGDTSHCTPDGRQHDIIYHAPECRPKWPAGADNGGATHRGVTGEKIKVLFYRERKNEAVAAILQAEGLARSRQEEIEFLTAAKEFLNTHYEFYGRELDLQLFEGNCPETPPNIPVCKAEAREIAKLDPFMVVWPVPLYPDVFDEFYKLGIVTIGGWHFEDRYFTQRRPYRYDLFMDGTQTADMVAEYYCKKMANKPATHTGRIIHRSIGLRGQVERRLGILSPENPAFLDAARRLEAQVARCDGNPPLLATYQSDIERAQSQSSANIAAMIDGKVTTIVCMCDPIAPVFRTNTATQQSYFPEHLLAGSGLLDYDKLGRLYEPRQWEHAFGPSHLQNNRPDGRSDADIVWNATGRPGRACGACNLPWAYYALAASMIQTAGPNLTPLTIERAGMQGMRRGGWQESGGRADVVLIKFGPGDYTGISDAREVYWSATATSALDGRPGAYVPMRGGRRYEHGQWSSSFDIPVPVN